MTLAEYIKTLDGAEILSIRDERVVGVRGTEVVAGGEVIDRLTTKAKAKALFDELVRQELGSDAEIAAMLKAEFGGTA